ncbi:MAG: hypothetical protein J6Y74_04525 [Clostridia bacterium]|nr:hypothetical protein [Clostridia bacterium]
MLFILASEPINTETYKFSITPLGLVLIISLVFCIIGFLIYGRIKKGNAKSDEKRQGNKVIELNGGNNEKPIGEGVSSLSPTTDATPQEKGEEQKGGSWKIAIGLICAVIFVVLVTIIPYIVMNRKAGSAGIISRSANNADITIKQDESLSFSYNLKITPKSDIENLQIEFKFYDQKGTLLCTKNKIIGNVSKNTQYSVSFALSEFSISSLTQISRYSWTVCGGTVK